MKNRVFFIFTLLVAIALIFPNLSLSKDDYIEKYKESQDHYYELLSKARAAGYDTTEAEELFAQAKLTEKEGFPRAALIVLEQAIAILEEKMEGQPDIIPPPATTEAPGPTVTPKATITPKPTETMKPTASPKPTETMKPTVTPKPTETMKPTASPKPTETMKPTVTPKPTETMKPTVTPKPTETMKPTVTPKPTETMKPTVTPKPTETMKPTVTPKPTETMKPTVTPKPTETMKPTETVKPEATPEPTETMKPTVTPEPGKTPISYENPEDCFFGFDGCHQSLFKELLPHYLETGAHWLLINSIIWEDNKPPDWNFIDEQIQLLTDEGFSLIIELHLSSPEFPEDPDDYGKFIARCVSRYDGDGDYNNDGITDGEPRPEILYWKISNEPALERYWEDSAEDYAELIRISGENAHNSNPKAKIIFGGFSNKGNLLGEKCNEEFMEEFLSYTFKDGSNVSSYLDIMDYHYYGTSKGLNTFIKTQLALLKKHNIEKPFIMTEYGYTGGVTFSFEQGGTKESSIRNQALEIVKAQVVALSLRAEKIIYFSFSDQKRQLKEVSNDTIFVSSKPAENIYTHDILSYNGLTYFDFEPKPALECYKAIVEKLKNRKISHELLGVGKDIRCFLFTDKKDENAKPIYILWNEGEEEQNISIETGWEQARMTSFLLIKDEEVYTTIIKAKKGSFELHLGKEPIIMEFIQ